MSVAAFRMLPQLSTGMYSREIRTATSFRDKNKQQQKSQLNCNNLFSRLKTTPGS